MSTIIHSINQSISQSIKQSIDNQSIIINITHSFEISEFPAHTHLNPSNKNHPLAWLEITYEDKTH